MRRISVLLKTKRVARASAVRSVSRVHTLLNGSLQSAGRLHASLINSSRTNMGTDGGRPVRPASLSEWSFGRDRNRSFHLRTVLSRQRSARAIAALL